MVSLPIDPLMPEIRAALKREHNLVLTAEPGAGKTTRVPPGLLPDGTGKIFVLEPRRLAARMSAARVADELSGKVGELVGYQVRFDDRSSPRTRLLYVTEGILLRRLLDDPKLAGVDVVVLDEFHERSIQSDLLLATLRQLQRSSRPDLRLCVMSATLEAEPVAAFLGGCSKVHAPGRLFPVTVDHDAQFDPRPLEDQVAAAVRAALARGKGNVLVFLPGMGEIRRAAARLGSLGEIDVLPLHGSLSPQEQDRAVRPGGPRKVILSTNVAETSLTIEGVDVVIDSGLARIAGHSTWSGLSTLKVQKISQASATQRAGRAGRTAAGRAHRLYTKVDHDARPKHEVPEIRRADLCEPLLLLRALGVRDPATFEWFDPPLPEALAAADELMHRIGALQGNELTPLGKRQASMPLHPRLSRVLLEAEKRGVGREAAVVVALLQERDLGRAAPDESSDSDPLFALDRFEEARRGNFSFAGLRRAGIEDPGGAQLVARTADQLQRLVKTNGPAPKDSRAELRCALLAGYPDRVARRRKPGGDELLLSGGGTAKLARESVVKQASLMVAIEAEEQRRAGESGIGLIRLASAIEPEWLLDLFADHLKDERRVKFNAEAERVDVEARLLYDELVLDESRADPKPEEVSEALAQAAIERGPSAYAPEGEPASTLARLKFVREAMPDLELPEMGPKEVEAAVRELAFGRRRFSELREGGFVELLLAPLSPKQRDALQTGAPLALDLPSGRRASIHYEDGKPPWLESRMQDFFGWTDAPKLAKGRVALTLHLLAPNQRAQQVTSDLAGFWERHYPAIRRELMRRYPRHAWPENPRVAVPRKPR